MVDGDWPLAACTITPISSATKPAPRMPPSHNKTFHSGTSLSHRSLYGPLTCAFCTSAIMQLGIRSALSSVK